jgi:ribose-phosphate pyrophosphokinase
MEIVKYPDSTSYVQVNYKQDCPNKTFKINTYEDLWHLNQFVDACNNNDRIPIITIPNLIDAQADRRFNKDESSGLKLVCKFLNKMKANFKIFHPHNPELVEALMDNVEIIDNSNFIKNVIDSLGPEYFFYKEQNHSDLILMSSDAGGFKPLMKLCDKIKWTGETVSASKYRSVATVNGEITTKLQQFVGNTDFNGKDILIVDDICIYGGTFKGLANLLRERNCGKLYLAVSHMTVQDLGEDSVTNYFDKVFTTNSKYDNYFVKDSVAGGKQPDNLTIIKMF